MITKKIIFTIIATIWVCSVYAGELTGTLNTWIDTWLQWYVVAVPTSIPSSWTYASSQNVQFTWSWVYWCLTTNWSNPSCDWVNLWCTASSKYTFWTTLNVSSTVTYKVVTCYPLSQQSPVWTFTFTISTPTWWWGWWGWWWGWAWSMDLCPSWDFSWNRYDNMCTMNCADYKSCILKNPINKEINCWILPKSCSLDSLNLTWSTSLTWTSLTWTNLLQDFVYTWSLDIQEYEEYSKQNIDDAIDNWFNKWVFNSSFQQNWINYIESQLWSYTYLDEDISQLIKLLKKNYYEQISYIHITSLINWNENYKILMEDFIKLIKEVRAYEKKLISKDELKKAVRKFLINYQKYRISLKSLIRFENYSFGNTTVKLFQLKSTSNSYEKTLKLINERLNKYLKSKSKFTYLEIQELKKSYNWLLLSMKYFYEVDSVNGKTIFLEHFNRFNQITK